MLRVAGTLSKSTEVMKEVNTIIKAPELQKTMVEMSKGKEQTGQTYLLLQGVRPHVRETRALGVFPVGGCRHIEWDQRCAAWAIS